MPPASTVQVPQPPTCTHIYNKPRPRDYIVRLEFPPVPPLNPPVVEVLDVSFRYGSNPWIFEGLNFGIDLDSRICIVGPNGSGR